MSLKAFSLAMLGLRFSIFKTLRVSWPKLESCPEMSHLLPLKLYWNFWWRKSLPISTIVLNGPGDNSRRDMSTKSNNFCTISRPTKKLQQVCQKLYLGTHCRDYIKRVEIYLIHALVGVDKFDYFRRTILVRAKTLSKGVDFWSDKRDPSRVRYCCCSSSCRELLYQIKYFKRRFGQKSGRRQSDRIRRQKSQNCSHRRRR